MDSTHTIRARERYDQLRALSEAGATKSEAARQVRVSLSGLHRILYREVGSRAWPIAATSQDLRHLVIDADWQEAEKCRRGIGGKYNREVDNLALAFAARRLHAAGQIIVTPTHAYLAEPVR